MRRVYFLEAQVVVSLEIHPNERNNYVRSSVLSSRQGVWWSKMVMFDPVELTRYKRWRYAGSVELDAPEYEKLAAEMKARSRKSEESKVVQSMET